MQQTLIK
jgi:hypothetical protein